MHSYHSQHSPLGAFASFTVGLVGAGGGFGTALRGPANQSLTIGYRRSTDAAWSLLPFYVPPTAVAEAAFVGEDVALNERPPAPRQALAPEHIQRTLGWASDTWRSDGFTFALLSPFQRVADPDTLSPEDARAAFAPVILATLGFDNRDGTTPVELVFGVADPDLPFRPIADAAPNLVGFAAGQGYGFATRPDSAIRAAQAFDVLHPKAQDDRGLHLLAQECALILRVEAGEQRTFPLALGFYYDGNVTTGVRTRYYYADLFADLEAVLAHGLVHADRLRALAAARDAELDASTLSADQRWILAQATHSYFGSTELLRTAEGRALWVVNEGEYRMMNTFDLTVDHLFFELTWLPWAMRNVLDQFTTRYRYEDAYGISFTHDMGIANQFTRPGHSSYECVRLHGCFSHMTMEQLVNWVCCAATYAEAAGDQQWLAANHAHLAACADSLHRRDATAPAARDGVLKLDSTRIDGGSEITTYDSLDVSLGQARNNLYLAVKTLAAWLLLERVFTRLGDSSAARDAADTAALLGATLERKFDARLGYFPAVFEAGNTSCILPAVEGLVFPLFLGFADDVRRRFPTLWEQLGRHQAHALQPGVCLEPANGGWKISSTSPNTWMSKIALAQHVTRVLFPAALGADRDTAAADAAHVGWLTGPACGRFAFVDQIRSHDGRDLGSRYYPRGVTACLWLRESAQTATPSPR